MVVAKGGPKITLSAGNPDDFPEIGFGREPGVLSLVGRNTGLNGVANGPQSNILDEPVVDQTGLTGRYDFTLRWMPDAAQWANFGVPRAWLRRVLSLTNDKRNKLNRTVQASLSL